MADDTSAIVLVPLRLFVGIIWLRAAAEKIIDPAWWDGSGVEAFLTTQLATGSVAAGWCARLAESVLLPNAQAVAWIVVVLQTVTGLAILLGAATAAFLLVGIAMNVTFVLMGVINPSAFYIPMQATLLMGDAGSVFGFERARALERVRTLRRWREALVCNVRLWRLATGVLAVIAALFAVQIDQFMPAQVVSDPFAVLALLSGLGALGAGIHAAGPDADLRWRGGPGRVAPVPVPASVPASVSHRARSAPVDGRTDDVPTRTAVPPRRPVGRTPFDDTVVGVRPPHGRRPTSRGLRLAVNEHDPAGDRRAERPAASTRAAAVRDYMASVRNPGAACDWRSITKLRAEIDRVDDDVARTRLGRWLVDLQQRSSAPHEDAFVQHAKAWADDAGVTGKAFAAEGVPAAVLRRAGFGDVTDGRQRRPRRGTTRRASGGNARVTADEVRAAIPSGAFTVKWLQERSGASAATVRRVVRDGVQAGSLTERGVDPDHSGPGRAPAIFARS